MSDKLDEVLRQIEELKAKADALMREEKAGAVAQVRELVLKYGITAKEIGLNADGSMEPKPARAKSEPKYRDPASGATWSGRGIPPKWIKEAQNRDDFLIK